ncbi:MAG TPA: DnaJ domain-containing protein [candidate division Zixibacteria bacterium]|nr:DnaJ domain-containing protein [candidate division Zixibacteria bacterium]
MAVRRDAYEILQLHPSARPEVVEAAYRALALVHHPDRNGNGDADAMADLNWAYAILRDPEQRAAYDRTRIPIPVGETAAPSGLLGRMLRSAEAAADGDATSPANVVIDFGRYAGYTLGRLVRIDREYLEWLRRHSAGARYRHQIDAVLRSVPIPVRASRVADDDE